MNLDWFNKLLMMVLRSVILIAIVRFSWTRWVWEIPIKVDYTHYQPLFLDGTLANFECVTDKHICPGIILFAPSKFPPEDMSNILEKPENLTRLTSKLHNLILRSDTCPLDKIRHKWRLNRKLNFRTSSGKMPNFRSITHPVVFVLLLNHLKCSIEYISVKLNQQNTSLHQWGL